MTDVVRVTVLLPAHLARALKRRADEEMTSQAAVGRWAIAAYLGNGEPGAARSEAKASST